MNTLVEELTGLETRFWQCLVSGDIDGALELLAEPAVIIGSHGVTRFDHAGYRRMVEQGPRMVKDFSLSEVEVAFPTADVALVTYKVQQTVGERDGNRTAVQQMADSSTWVRQGGRWRCALHTETALQS